MFLRKAAAASIVGRGGVVSLSWSSLLMNQILVKPNVVSGLTRRNGNSIRTTLTDTTAAAVKSGKGEVDVATIPILTTDSHPLGRIVKVHGVVSASSVRNKNILIDAYVAIKGIFGGSAPLYEDLVNEAYVSAANGLAEAAHQIGATHVIQVRFEKAVIITRFVIGTHCFVSAYGTAVDVELDGKEANPSSANKKSI
jgi:uncharacterized protein YbjQ (UPF0145 family)